MSGAMRYRNPELQEQLASEYVLGTLRGLARKRFERLLREDRELLMRVRAWEDKMQPLHELTAEVEPDRKVWKDIQLALQGKPDPLLKRLNLYRWLSFGGLACTLVLTVLLWSPWQVPVESGRINYVAVMQDEGGIPNMVATLTQAGRTLRMDLLRKPTVVEGEQLQLWAQSREDGKIRHLGTIAVQKELSLALTKEEWGLISSADYLLVSIEPSGLAPEQPGLRIVSKGLCVKVEGWASQAG